MGVERALEEAEDPVVESAGNSESKLERSNLEVGCLAEAEGVCCFLEAAAADRIARYSLEAIGRG